MTRQANNAPFSQRQLRVGELIKQSLGQILLRDEAKVPGLETKNITVTEVRMSPDLKNAKAYVIPLGGKDTEKAVDVLTEFSHLIRKALSKKVDRKRLFNILAKNFNSPGEKVWLKRRFKEYKIEDRDLSKLKMRMDIIPVSMALAQAANESGWGTSRFALEGNALFGQWTWSKKGITPKNKDPDQNHKILQFQILKASVRAYKNNLNTHNAYKEFREVRAKLRQSGTKITGLALIKYLKNYSAIGVKYTEIIEGIIVHNSLTDFDKANLLPTKLKTGIAL